MRLGSEAPLFVTNYRFEEAGRAETTGQVLFKNGDTILVGLLFAKIHEFVSGLHVMFVCCFWQVLLFLLLGELNVLQANVELRIEDFLVVWV